MLGINDFDLKIKKKKGFAESLRKQVEKLSPKGASNIVSNKSSFVSKEKIEQLEKVKLDLKFIKTLPAREYIKQNFNARIHSRPMVHPELQKKISQVYTSQNPLPVSPSGYKICVEKSPKSGSDCASSKRSNSQSILKNLDEINKIIGSCNNFYSPKCQIFLSPNNARNTASHVKNKTFVMPDDDTQCTENIFEAGMARHAGNRLTVFAESNDVRKRKSMISFKDIEN